jgi:hypothetical protein
MRWGKYSDGAGVFQRVWEMVQEGRDGVGETNGGEDAGAEEGVSAEGVEEGIVGAGNVGVNPREVGELLYGEFANRSFFALSHPF